MSCQLFRRSFEDFPDPPPENSQFFDDSARLSGDDQLFVGGDDQNFDLAAGLGNLMDGVARAFSVLGQIELRPHIFQSARHRFAHVRIVLADPGGKDDRIRAAQRRRIRADVFFDAIGKQIEREAGEAIAEQLRAMAHEVEIVDDRTAMGRGEIIWKCENGVYAAGTEPRCDGTVASW